MTRRKRPDNRGSVLILVMIAMSFISILGATILSSTFINYKIKLVDRTSKDNFYEAEAILDEIKAGLEVISSEKAQAAYEKFLANYTKYATDADRRAAFSKYYLEGIDPASGDYGLIQALGGTPGGTTVYNTLLLQSFINAADQTAFVTDPAAAILEINGTDSVVLKNIKIAYSKRDYGTTLTTDIVMDVPDFKYNKASANGGPEFGEYSLIADSKLSVLSGAIQTYGGVYAGNEGIFVSSAADYTLTGSRIVTRGDVCVENNGKLKLGFERKEDVPGGWSSWNKRIGWKPDVWASNIRTKTSGAAGPAMEINANCYVANDLQLDGEGSEAKFGKGSQYIGYGHSLDNATGAAAVIDSEYSSAILVNGKNSTLDLRGLSSLVLPGRAFVSKKAVDGGAGTGGAVDIMMGESVSVKLNQTAYLVPSKYIVDSIGSNPMTKAAYDSVVSGPSLDVNLLVKEDLLEGDGIKKYLAPSGGMIKMIFPAGVGPMSNMAYCYFNFRDEDAANQYFQHYVNSLPADAMSNSLSNFLSSSGIQMKDPGTMRRVDVAGNFMTYDSTNGYQIYENTVTPSALDMGEYQKYAKKYKNLTETLTETTAGTGLNMFDELIDRTALLNALAALPYGGGSYSETIPVNGVNHILRVVNGPYHVTSPESGILIALGDVTVSADYTGLIISAGEIQIPSTSVTTKADPVMVKQLLETNARNVPGTGSMNVAACFKDYSPSSYSVTSGGGTINVSGFIRYENWRKN